MLHAARELALFQDEPPQLPSGSFGKSGRLRLGLERRGDRTVLSTLHRRAPLIVQQALYWDEEMPGLPCICMISNAGGILQGDRNVVEIALAEAAQAHVTTQSATRIHEMDANYATQDQIFTLEAGAYLEFIPHPIIPHRHSRFAQRTRVSIDPTATLLYSEVLTGGRKHYAEGEAFAYDVFSSHVSAARPDGSSLFTERFVVEPARYDVSRLGLMGDFHVFGNLIVLTPTAHLEPLLAAIAPRFDAEAGLAMGASRLPRDAGLAYKVLGHEAAPVVAAIRQVWDLVRRQVVGAAVPERFLWG
ncbi:MAG: urease accessory protein UreD [Mesorhizobium sp.]